MNPEEIAETLDAGTPEPEAVQNEETPQPEASSEAPNEGQPREEAKNDPPPGLLDERRKRQELERRLAETESSHKESLQALEARMREEFEALKPKPQEISVEVDPIGYFQDQIDKINTKFEEEGSKLREKTDALDKHNSEREQFQRTVNQIQGYETSFAKNHEDYYQAVEHVVNLNREMYKMYNMKEQQIEQLINKSMFDNAVYAISQGIDPAEYMYNVAKTLGFQKQKAGGISDKDAAELNNLERGLNASKTLGSNAPPDNAEEPDEGHWFDDTWNQVMKDAGMI